MPYNHSYAKSFQYGLMFGKNIKPGDEVKTSVLDEHDVLLAIRKAYIDMTPRTFKSENEKRSIDPKRKEALFMAIATRIVAYMKNGAEDFENWHKGICKFFIMEFREILMSANKKTDDATYGKAQKIINMTFKYIYCFDNAPEYHERFIPCHMALDSYILNWFFDWYLKEYNEGKPRNRRITKAALPKWSRLHYKKENEDDIIPQYIEIQDAIRDHLQVKKPGVPRIEAEFLIWYDEKNKMRK